MLRCISKPNICVNGSNIFHRKNTPHVFEGSQGVLLDYEHGFWPHVTKSKIRFPDIKTVCKIGVIRAYQTRHGNGFFLTEDPELDDYLQEPHNLENKWQGKFRRGWLDLVSLRYALNVVGGVDFLAVTHLDCVEKIPVVKICNRYLYKGEINSFFRDNFSFEIVGGQVYIADILVRERDENERISLVECLNFCTPEYTEIERSEDKLIQFIENNVKAKIKIRSYGLTYKKVVVN